MTCVRMACALFSSQRNLVSCGLAVLLILSFVGLCGADVASQAALAFGPNPKEYEFIQEDVYCDKLENNDRQCSRLNESHLNFYLSLFVTIAWGAAIRTVIKTFELSIPYTVLLTITGFIVGLGCRIKQELCINWSKFTRFARTPPEIILYVFLPVLLFESAFSMNSHVFVRSSLQILTAALPGMVITTFLTAFACLMVMTEYEWNLAEATLFGAIVSATDPVAVVAILRESGTSETLSVMIEGESLLNDGVAILLYDIFKGIVETNSSGDQIQGIAIKFVKITVGGPVFGYFMAKLTILCLCSIFNDAATEITITLVSAYLTYFVAEFYLEFSGVMAVVVLGVTISAASTAVSPEVTHVMHQFWEMMSFLANTVLFVILGIVISETAINSMEAKIDLPYALWLYIILNVIRFLMLILLSPLLSRVGYGITWRTLLVMTWGGLRGAVGICLALEIFQNKKLCYQKNIGPKFLIQTAGIVMSTLILNGTTTKMLLDGLGITTLSVGKIQDMANAVKTITASRLRSISILKHDRFLAESNWEIVHKYTHLKNPYAKKHKAHEKKTKRLLEEKRKTEHSLRSIASAKMLATVTGTEDYENADQANIEDSEEFKALMEETRLRVLKAYKISFWRQYESGTLGEQAVKILVSAVEEREDQFLTMLHSADLGQRWGLSGVFVTLKKKLYSFMFDDAIPPKPTAKWRHGFYWLTTKSWFDIIIYCIILLNLITIVWAIVLQEKEIKSGRENSTLEKLDIVEVFFLCIYIIEFTVKWVGRGPKNYFSIAWNWLDFFVLIVSIVDLALTHFNPGYKSNSKTNYGKALKALRLVRILRMLRWLKPLIPLINRFLQARINSRLFLGYDVGRGFVQAVEEALTFVPQMGLQQKVLLKFQSVLNHDRLQTLKELALVQQVHSGVVAAVKTRHASRAICNQMRDELFNLKEDGLLNEKEFEILVGRIEENMKRLWSLPVCFRECPPEILVAHVPWIMGSDAIKAYFMEKAFVQELRAGDMIYYKGDEPNGLHMVVSGLVRLHFEPPVEEDERDDLEKGLIPNTELFFDPFFQTEIDDYFGCGILCGEIGVLTYSPRASSIRCETDVTLFHWPHLVIRNAIGIFGGEFDSLECRFWRSFGVKFAAEFLKTEPDYASWSTGKIRSHLEQGIVPIGQAASVIDLPEEVTECILIYGRCKCFKTEEVYTAPCCLPTATRDLFVKIDGDPNVFRVLVVADYEALQGLRDSTNLTPLQKCFIYGPVMKDLGDILGDVTDALREENPMESSSTIMSSSQRISSTGV